MKNKQTATKKQNSQFSIRPAETEDIDALVDICRKGFPDLVRWQIPRFLAKKSWEHILSSAVAETWVCNSGDQVAALVSLVSNMVVYQSEKHPPNMSRIKKLYFHLLCPKLLVKKLLRKICRFFSGSTMITSLGRNQSETTNFAWIELIAVAPDMRKKGMATRLLELCYERTVQLKIDGMKLTVEPDNIAAHNLYKGFGFHCTSQGGDTDIYTMKIERKNSPGRIKAIS